MHHLATLTLLVAAIGTATTQGPTSIQRAASPELSFDVVSIKPNTSGSGGMTIGMRGGRLTMVNGTPMTLVMNAYPQQSFHIFGAPSWMTSERYDVTATTTRGDPSGEEYRAMVKALLVERVKLVAHTEVRQLPIYALVIARGDEKLGPRIRRWDTDCDAVLRPRAVALPRLRLPCRHSVRQCAV